MKLPIILALAVAFIGGALLSESANAQPGGAREQLEGMFENISKETKWDMSKNMLWGYFFTNSSRPSLDAAAQLLSKSGYRVVDIYLSEKEEASAPDLWWLHVERVETHSIDSLLKRNAELAEFAKSHSLASYDGMDVGPVEGPRQ